MARRLALDHTERVSRLALLDIVPTRTLYESLDQMRATTVWRYLFLIQPQDLPERLLDANKDLYLDWTFAEWSADSDSLASEAVTEYRRCFDELTVHASCEDYRAGASIDLIHHRADYRLDTACRPWPIRDLRGDLPRMVQRPRRARQHCQRRAPSTARQSLDRACHRQRARRVRTPSGHGDQTVSGSILSSFVLNRQKTTREG